MTAAAWMARGEALVAVERALNHPAATPAPALLSGGMVLMTAATLAAPFYIALSHRAATLPGWTTAALVAGAALMSSQEMFAFTIPNIAFAVAPGLDARAAMTAEAWNAVVDAGVFTAGGINVTALAVALAFGPGRRGPNPRISR